MNRPDLGPWLARCRWPAPAGADGAGTGSIPTPARAAEPAAAGADGDAGTDGPTGPAGRLALAVSGGADSSALAVLAAAAGFAATVYHVDHGLRPGSPAEADRVRALAEDLGFAFVGLAVEVPAGANLEARARQARYGVLPAGVLTGHTMDDLAETVLLNVLRGAALDGLAPMTGPYAHGRVTRPLLALRRRDTEAVCAAWGVEPVQDPTNGDGRYTRNRVRTELLPLIADIAQRDPVPVLARQAGLLGADADYLDRLAAPLDPTDARALRSAPEPLARRALRAFVRSGDEGHPPSEAELERVMQVVRGERVACELGGGRRLRRSAGRLELSAPPRPDRIGEGPLGRGSPGAAGPQRRPVGAP